TGGEVDSPDRAPACAAGRTPGADGGRRDCAAAARHGERVRVSHARGRNGNGTGDYPARSLPQTEAPPRGLFRPGRGGPSPEAGRDALGEGGEVLGPTPGERNSVTRFSLIVTLIRARVTGAGCLPTEQQAPPEGGTGQDPSAGERALRQTERRH